MFFKTVTSKHSVATTTYLTDFSGMQIAFTQSEGMTVKGLKET